MKNQKTWLIGIIVALVLMNMIILTFFWLGERPPNPNKIRHHLTEELNLSETQEETFSLLFEAHLSDRKAIMDSIKNYKEKMMELLVEPDKDMTELNALIQKIGVLETRKDKILVQHFIALENACESEVQKEKLRGLFMKSMPKHRPQPQ